MELTVNEITIARSWTFFARKELLDDRKFEEWLEPLTRDILYQVAIETRQDLLLNLSVLEVQDLSIVL
jgi:3-phenylpropionate/cinnamic acid dioxygenase small subunit